MNLLGLDIATRLTGWTAGSGETLPVCDVMRFPQVDDDYGRLIDLFDQNLCVIFDRFNPGAVVYEAPILVVNRKKKRGRPENSFDPAPEASAGGWTDKPRTLRKIYSMGVYLEFFCRRRGVECSEVTLQAIKKEVTGNHMAEKDDLVAVARKVGLALPAGEGAKDAADSWGAWLIGLRHYDPNTSRRWDKMIWTPRGALL